MDYRINWAAESEGLSDLDGFERERIPDCERLHDHGIGRGRMLQSACAGALWRERRRLDRGEGKDQRVVLAAR